MTAERKQAEEILENTMRCTIDDDADLDDPQNYYFQYKDVLRAMKDYAEIFAAWCLDNVEQEWELGSDKVRYYYISDTKEMRFNTINKLLEYWKQNISK